MRTHNKPISESNSSCSLIFQYLKILEKKLNEFLTIRKSLKSQVNQFLTVHSQNKMCLWQSDLTFSHDGIRIYHIELEKQADKHTDIFLGFKV